jgi:hypothetical protein
MIRFLHTSDWQLGMKSSLGEAINTILDYQDNSKGKDIQAIQPVHQDVGPEIELEMETGKYVFTYFKRFLRKPETRLTITKPIPENLDRVHEILKETLDVDLWKALSIMQGEAIDQPELKNKQALSAALDKAAGVQPSASQEIGLFKRISQEYELYYTMGRGTEKKELQDLRKPGQNLSSWPKTSNRPKKSSTRPGRKNLMKHWRRT